MSIEDEARKQADRSADHVFEEWNPFSNTVDAWTDGFTEGAVWASQREPTDAEIEAAAKAFGGLTTTDWEHAAEWERDAVLESMRRALSARNTRENQ